MRAAHVCFMLAACCVTRRFLCRYREFLRSHTHVGVMCALGSALVARSDSVGALGVYMLALGVDPTNARVKLAIDQVTATTTTTTTAAAAHALSAPCA